MNPKISRLAHQFFFKISKSRSFSSFAHFKLNPHFPKNSQKINFQKFSRFSYGILKPSKLHTRHFPTLIQNNFSHSRKFSSSCHDEHCKDCEDDEETVSDELSSMGKKVPILMLLLLLSGVFYLKIRKKQNKTSKKDNSIKEKAIERYELKVDDIGSDKFLKELMRRFAEKEEVPKEIIENILKRFYISLISSPHKNVIKFNFNEDVRKVTVVGDTHGQWHDVLKIFNINGLPSSDNPYIFNGDFVDRGFYSIENVITLFTMWLNNNESIYLIKGNHENRRVNVRYGFQSEVHQRYGERAYELFQTAFNMLPLACVVNKKIFILHGGIGFPEGVTINDIENVERARGNEHEKGSVLTEILWSDPHTKENEGKGRVFNEKRRIGHLFGAEHVEKFLENNNLNLIIRSHQAKKKGFEVHFGKKLITLFSCPNYCGVYGNLGAFIIIRGDKFEDLEFVSFE